MTEIDQKIIPPSPFYSSPFYYVTRLMGLLLAVIAVQFVVDGITTL